MKITKHGKIGGPLYRGVEMYRGKRMTFFARSPGQLMVKVAQWKVAQQVAA